MDIDPCRWRVVAAPEWRDAAVGSMVHEGGNVIKWPRRYAARLLLSDLFVVGVTLAGFLLVVSNSEGLSATVVPWPSGPDVPYWVALVVVGAIWMLALDATDSRDEHVVGNGAAEYDRVFRSTLVSAVIVMAIAYFARVDLARSLFLIAFPCGLVLLLASRWLWRQWLRRQQRRGSNLYRAIVVGEPRKAAHIIQTLQQTAGTGTEILGAVTGMHEGEIGNVPVLGRYRDLESIVDETDADTVIFCGADEISPKVLRRIGWQMADRDVRWIVAPAMTDVAGPRIHARPVAGLPLIHVSFPRLDGPRRFLKRTFDVVGSGVMIVLLSPVLLGAAIAVRADSPGSVLYRQQRIGRHGKPFMMTKFRSMRINADDELKELLAQQDRSAEPLFKFTNDPRITRVGRFIRKYSIDELPQLFDVFRGAMSLVGPRPQVEAEVALYDDAAHRRLMVKPGMSGLWQVSGRSETTWEDAVRLDLYYVENWSFMQDIIILFRTVRAVIAPGDSAH